LPKGAACNARKLSHRPDNKPCALGLVCSPPHLDVPFKAGSTLPHYKGMCMEEAGCGQPCKGPRQCKGTDLFCKVASGAKVGTCVQRPMHGQACAPDVYSSCMGSASCRWYPIGGAKKPTCWRFSSVGEYCGTGVPCRYNLYCAKNKCVSPPKVGEACASNYTSKNLCGSGKKCVSGICQSTCPKP